MGWAGRLVQPQPRPALTLSPWALAGPGIRDPAAWCPPLPAAPIFSLGLIGCQDLPNVSSSIRVFKRAPEAIFKREAGASADEGMLLTATLVPPQPARRAAAPLWAWTHSEAWGKTRLGRELSSRTPAGRQEGGALIGQIQEC